MKQEEKLAMDNVDIQNSQEDITKKRIPIAKWPDIERNMAIISRMTSDRS